MRTAIGQAGFRVYWGAEHRTAKCEVCGHVGMEKVEIEGKLRPRCPRCGGKGELISRAVSVQPPGPPQCLSFRCLFGFFRDCLFVALLQSYHRRRVAYAEANRNKPILLRYRRGEPAPRNIWQAIHANIKLSCPVCRNYDIDPLLFGGKKDGTDTNGNQ